MKNLEIRSSPILNIARESRARFPMDRKSPLQVSHDPQNHYFNAREYLMAAHANGTYIDRFLDERGFWSFKDGQNIDITGLTPQEALKLLQPFESPLLDLSMASLLEGHQYTIEGAEEPVGLFNDHTYSNHIQATWTMVEKFMQMAGIEDKQTYTDAAAAVACHDSFGFLGRPNHNLDAARGVKRMFPNLTGGNKRRMREIQSAIFLHNETVYRGTPFNLKGVPFHEKVELMRHVHTPMSAALILADKAEIRRERVIPQALRPKIVDAHHHTRGNLYTNFANLSQDNNNLIMTFNHNPWVESGNPLYKDLFEKKVDDQFYQIYAPQTLKNPDGQISIENVYGEMWRLYGPHQQRDADRFSLMIAAGFVLFPGIEAFHIDYVHKFERQRVIQREFRLNNADVVLQELATATHPYKII
jgi:hypothetical protein